MKTLSPDQLADLRKSGLTDSTIELMQCEGVRPKELPIKQAESAYRLTYFDLNGKPNGFARLKLVPAVVGPDGHHMKYYQPKDSQPRLYLPPLLNWSTVAKHSTTELIITEGEKKAAAACQRGLITAGVGGVWCWTSTLDNGEHVTLPMFDEFQWTNRSVLLCPDSDVWRDEKVQALRGFFGLAKFLQQQGASVQFVILPELHGVKCGLDDWLLVPGNDIEQSWQKSKRISLDDVRCNTLTAWWQKWKEKQATHDAIKQRDADELEVTETAGLYVVRSAKHAVRMTFDRLADERGSVYAELSIVLGATEILSGSKLGLQSDGGQSKLAGSLKAVAASVPWKTLLQRACSLVLKCYRRGSPSLILNKESTMEHLTYALNPLVFVKKTTIGYGDGGLGKSTWALFCAMVVSTGGTVAGISALRGRALYLDWEDDADVHCRRLHAIQQGHPELTAAEILYQRCCEPLTKLVYPLVRRIHDEHITFVVVDSILAATGGDSSAEGTAKLFAALRLLNCEILALGHVPKTLGEGQDHPFVYGSVFNQNFARSVWEMKKEQEVGEDTAILGLFNRKSNLSRLHHPIGLKVTQNADSTCIVYEPYDLSQAAELKKALPWPGQIRNLLDSDGVPRSSKEIADELGAPHNSIKTTLSHPRHKGLKWSMLGEGKETKWTTLNR